MRIDSSVPIIAVASAPTEAFSTFRRRQRQFDVSGTGMSTHIHSSRVRSGLPLPVALHPVPTRSSSSRYDRPSRTVQNGMHATPIGPAALLAAHATSNRLVSRISRTPQHTKNSPSSYSQHTWCSPGTLSSHTTRTSLRSRTSDKQATHVAHTDGTVHPLAMTVVSSSTKISQMFSQT